MTREQIEKEILREHGIEELAPNVYGFKADACQAAFRGRSDDGFACLWECDCPDGKSGKTCKHIRQLSAAIAEICYELGYE